MQLPWKLSAQEPRHLRYWKHQQHQLDYWLFFLCLVAALGLLYGLIALLQTVTAP
jgi:hypothetical protein